MGIRDGDGMWPAAQTRIAVFSRASTWHRGYVGGPRLLLLHRSVPKGTKNSCHISKMNEHTQQQSTASTNSHLQKQRYRQQHHISKVRTIVKARLTSTRTQRSR